MATMKQMTITMAALAALTLGPVPAQAQVGGASCGNPSGGAIQAPERLGGYWGNRLPATFKHLRTERQVDRAITRMSRTASWPCFQEFYGGAVRKWSENTKRR